MEKNSFRKITTCSRDLKTELHGIPTNEKQLQEYHILNFKPKYMIQITAFYVLQRANRLHIQQMHL